MRLASWLPLLAFAATLTARARADDVRSYTVHDGAGLNSMRLESPRPEATVCVIVPSKAGSCDGLPVVQLEAQATSAAGDLALVAMGFVRFESYGIQVTVQTMRMQTIDMSAEALDELVTGMRKALASRDGAKVVLEPHRTRIREREAVEAEVEVPSGRVPARNRLVTLFGRDRIHQVSFIVPAERREDAQTTIDHMLGTLEYDAGDLGYFGKSKGEIQRLQTTKTLVTGAPLLLLGAAGYLVWARVRKGKGDGRKRPQAAKRPSRDERD